MNNQLVQTITKSQIRSDLPKFGAGDTIKVALRITENGKSRIQYFQGVVISRRGTGVSETFIIRKESDGVGVGASVAGAVVTVTPSFEPV